MKNLIVYGDIHGCFDELVSLRKKITPSSGDVEVCVGDVITKGTHSIKVLDYLISCNILSVLGNHESKIIRYLKQREKKRIKGEKISLNSDEKNIVNSLSDKHIHYLNSMPLFLKFKNIVILHGGLQNHMSLERLSKSDVRRILRMRYLNKQEKFLKRGEECESSHFWADVYRGGEGFVIYGHTPFSAPRISLFALGIDTGCVYGNRLSAVVFEDCEAPEQHKIFQVASGL